MLAKASQDAGREGGMTSVILGALVVGDPALFSALPGGRMSIEVLKEM